MAPLRCSLFLACAFRILGAAAGTVPEDAGRIIPMGPPRPGHGRVGQTVLLLGHGLGGATGVMVGGVAARTFSVAPDGAALTFQVPPAARSGPVELETASGTFRLPGVPFTVEAARPAIVKFLPARGGPGTEVTLTGSGLGDVDHVRFGGGDLDRSRFDVDSDAQVRVRVPDDALSGGFITLGSPEGMARTEETFEVVPTPDHSRRLPLDASRPPGSGEETWLNFPVADRSDLYGREMPKAPVFQPLHPDGRNPDGSYGLREARTDLPIVHTTRFTLSLRLPPSFLPSLPPALLGRLRELRIAPENVDILCASQDFLYDGGSGPGSAYLLRPHPWTDPGAPMYGAYAATHHLGAALFETAPGMTLGDHPEGDWFEFTIETRADSEDEGGQVLALGGGPALAGFNVDTSTAFWSLVADLDRGNAAATLHLLFNDPDQGVLDGLTPSWHTLDDLVQGLVANLGGTRGVDLLKRLFRPRVDAVTLSACRIPGTWLATIKGSGLSEIRAVLLDGRALPSFQRVSDAQAKAHLPAGAAGRLQVTTALGASDPVDLP